MGTITISVDAGTGNQMTKTFNVTNSNLLRLATWAKTMGSPGNPGETLTNVQALERWAVWAVEMSKSHLLATERQQVAVADFSAT